MSEEDEKILNNLVNKKKQVLEFKEVQSIVRLLLDVNKKINRKCKLSLLWFYRKNNRENSKKTY